MADVFEMMMLNINTYSTLAAPDDHPITRHSRRFPLQHDPEEMGALEETSSGTRWDNDPDEEEQAGCL